MFKKFSRISSKFETIVLQIAEVHRFKQFIFRAKGSVICTDFGSDENNALDVYGNSSDASRRLKYTKIFSDLSNEKF